MPTETPTTSKPSASSRRTWNVRVWRLLIVFLILAHLFPVRFGSLRAIIVLTALAAWFTALPLFWVRRWVRAVWVMGTLIVGALICGPGRADNSMLLRNEYVASLMKYEGVRYIWGGENSRGVDCSGLVRIGLIDADFNRGIQTLNPGLIREGIRLWWFDCSADALKKEYRNNTISLFDTTSLNRLGYSRLLPGDFAVTESGLHTLAYTGNRTWIEADPGPMRVVSVTVPSTNIWFEQPMRIVRWRQLQ